MRFQRIVVIGDDGPYARSVTMGIFTYAQLKNRWELHFESNPGTGDLSRLRLALRQWNPQGIIAQLQRPTLARMISNIGIPVVNFSDERPTSSPTVTSDNHAAGRLAARHLLDNGFGHFAFYANNHHRAAQQHGAGFRQALTQSGFDCDLFPAPVRGGADHSQWAIYNHSLEQWLGGLPRPAALLCTNDFHAQELTLTCRRLGLQVPQHIAVIGVGNDPAICPKMAPALSSVDIDAPRIGYVAAELLDALLSGQPAPAQPILIPPREIVVRLSSDVIAVSDPQVATALQFIRAHAGEPINVKDLLNICSLTRRMLDLRFQQALGRTISREIKRVRIERAKDLLRRSPLSIRAVARAAGFHSPRLFARLFHQITGILPTQYRAQTQSQSTG